VVHRPEAAGVRGAALCHRGLLEAEVHPVAAVANPLERQDRRAVPAAAREP